jgi:hypothetical protein
MSEPLEVGVIQQRRTVRLHAFARNAERFGCGRASKDEPWCTGHEYLAADEVWADVRQDIRDAAAWINPGAAGQRADEAEMRVRPIHISAAGAL